MLVQNKGQKIEFLPVAIKKTSGLPARAKEQEPVAQRVSQPGKAGF